MFLRTITWLLPHPSSSSRITSTLTPAAVQFRLSTVMPAATLRRGRSLQVTVSNCSCTSSSSSSHSCPLGGLIIRMQSSSSSSAITAQIMLRYKIKQNRIRRQFPCCRSSRHLSMTGPVTVGQASRCCKHLIAQIIS
jgi:hypothetical protein